MRHSLLFNCSGRDCGYWGIALAKPNYQFEKRQRELEKKRKKDEKRQLALATKSGASVGDDDGSEPAQAADSAESVGAAPADNSGTTPGS